MGRIMLYETFGIEKLILISLIVILAVCLLFGIILGITIIGKRFTKTQRKKKGGKEVVRNESENTK